MTAYDWDGKSERRRNQADPYIVSNIDTKLNNLIELFHDHVDAKRNEHTDHELRIRNLETYKSELKGSIRMWGLFIALLQIMIPLLIKLVFKQ